MTYSFTVAVALDTDDSVALVGSINNHVGMSWHVQDEAVFV